MRKTQKIIFIFLILAVTVGLDQLTKVWAQSTLRDTPVQSYLGGIFLLEYAENPGAFLSLGAAMSEQNRTLAFVTLTSIFLLGALYYILRYNVRRLTLIAISLLIGGGIGNIIDRILIGRVVDFMNLGIGSVRTGIFNIADMAIVAAVVIMFAESFMEKKVAPR